MFSFPPKKKFYNLYFLVFGPTHVSLTKLRAHSKTALPSSHRKTKLHNVQLHGTCIESTYITQPFTLLLLCRVLFLYQCVLIKIMNLSWCVTRILCCYRNNVHDYQNFTIYLVLDRKPDCTYFSLTKIAFCTRFLDLSIFLYNTNTMF